MGVRYGGSIWEIGRQWDIDRDIDMGHEISIWAIVYRYGHPPYRYGHPGYRYEIWANDMGDDSIHTVISHIATTQFWWGGQMEIARGAVRSRSLS